MIQTRRKVESDSHTGAIDDNVIIKTAARDRFCVAVENATHYHTAIVRNDVQDDHLIGSHAYPTQKEPLLDQDFNQQEHPAERAIPSDARIQKTGAEVLSDAPKAITTCYRDRRVYSLQQHDSNDDSANTRVPKREVLPTAKQPKKAYCNE